MLMAARPFVGCIPISAGRDVATTVRVMFKVMDLSLELLQVCPTSPRSASGT
jgi:hypothetical protein